MKIISKFKDFYDSISHKYLDKEILYVRESKTLNVDSKDIPNVARFAFRMGTDVPDYVFSLEIIGFCGRLYPVVVVSNSGISATKYNKGMIGFFDIEDLKKFVHENKIPIREDRKYRLKIWRFHNYQETVEDFERFFSNKENFNKLEGIFLEHNAPVFVARMEKYSKDGYKIVLNPILKNYSFTKVKDPFSAHQELYQFVSGYLKSPERDMVTISDEDKIHKHGFNKWSFRKLPGKKK